MREFFSSASLQTCKTDQSVKEPLIWTPPLLLRESTIVDAESGLTHTLVTTAANVNDVTQAHALLHGQEADVFGDVGYTGVAKRDEHRNTDVTWHIAMRPGKRRGRPDTLLGRLLERVEQTKARIRTKVGHPFHVLKSPFKHRRTPYRGLAKNTVQLFMLFGLANRVPARRRLLSDHAQGAS